MLIADQKTINFALKEDSEKIEDLVVVGYGVQRRESVIGAISSAKVADLRLPTVQLSTSLAGQVAGVLAIQRSGEPGSHSDFWIRGISSLNQDSRKPLILVDGIERDMDLVDVEDIQSFSILKDATATAIYGVRGANGVVLITTRAGEKGAPKVTVRAEAGIVQPTQMAKFANSVQFADAYNNAYQDSHNGEIFYSPETIGKYADGSDPDLFPNVNWIDGLFKSVTSNQKINANVSGGGDVARYFISGSFYNEGGLYKVDEMQRYKTAANYNKFNFRANIDINLTPSTVLSVNLSNVYEVTASPNKDTKDIWKSAFVSSPNSIPMRYSDGKLSVPQGSSIGDNPYNLITQTGFKNKFANNSQALVGLNKDFSEIITKGLKFNAKFSWDAVTGQEQFFVSEPTMYIATGRDPETNELMYDMVREGKRDMNYSKRGAGNKIFYVETSLSYDRAFDKHRLAGLFLFNLKSRKDMQADDINKAIPYRHQGIAGRFTYSFDDRYFVEGNFGYNGSENFSPGKRFGFFPSGALGWMISNEKFFQPLTHVVDVLKIRGSYGVVGNDNIGGNRRFIYNSTYENVNGSYMFGGNTGMLGGIRKGDFANPGVSWEKSYKLDLGVELSLFNALKIQADYFSDHRQGIFLQNKEISSIVGLNDAPWLNVGETVNRGFDAQVEGMRKFGEVTVSLRGNFTFNRSEIIEDGVSDQQYAYLNRKGKPIDQQYGLIALGLYQSEEEINNSPRPSGIVRVGDIKYKDSNGDGAINENDYVPIGRSWLPEIVYGFGASVQYRKFDVSVLFQGVGNVTMFLNGPAIWPFASNDLKMSGFYRDVYDKMWTKDNPNPNAEFPRVSDSKSTNNHQYRSTY